MWKNNIYFILVEPSEPGNTGSAARAIKNMGFKNLVMANPVNCLTGKTGRLACNSLALFIRFFYTYTDLN
ncbi:putative RNA methyltransferase [bacterium BMS3Abin07]|nr:putative RNA methyltransferase [bacterium BMS3Abin07]GBE33224.1 putative RNA methyltransferase [bacterium BMS3Bbin05]HDO22762.1 hypothetical protein [Nitrospirota bacterium]HDZ87509.1 hypothetical protein [Nitrospirota bacterium]